MKERECRTNWCIVDLIVSYDGSEEIQEGQKLRVSPRDFAALSLCRKKKIKKLEIIGNSIQNHIRKKSYSIII